MVVLDFLGQEKADVAAAEDQQPPRRRLLVAEGAHGARHLIAVDDEIDLVAGQHLVVPRGHDGTVFAHEPDDDDIEVGEQLGELPERRIDQGTGILAAHAQQLHLVVGQGNHLERPGHLEAPRHRAGHFDLGRDDDVDGHVVAGKQIRPDGVQVALVTHAGDLGRHVENRMGHLTGHHVDLVGIGHRDDHVRVRRARFFQDVGVRGMADDPLHVEGVGDLVDQLRRLVDDRDVVFFQGQMPGNVEAHLSGAADDYLHGLETSAVTPAPGRSAGSSESASPGASVLSGTGH